MHRRLSCVLVALAACGGDLVTSSTEQAMEGRLRLAEIAVDAPWRIEPEIYEALGTIGDPTTPSPIYRYGKVPIVVSIRDADIGATPWQIHSVDVFELGTGFSHHFELANFHEIEWTTGKWPWPLPNGDFELPEAQHRLCRLWRNEACQDAFTAVRGASEWDALLFYVIQQPTSPGMDVRLQIRLNHERREIRENPNDPADAEYYFFDDAFDNEVVVHLGEAPLPTFGNGWAYGDLHYHSQGTDNEGEAGYGHRATLHAVSAIGLDFVLASEHASSSGQLSRPVPGALFETLRDMSAGRFRTLRRRLNDAGGANAEVASHQRWRSPARLSAPQMFLGGEVDVYPEVSPAEAASGLLAFGSTARYALDTCQVVTPGVACDGRWDLLRAKCTRGGSLQVQGFPPVGSCTTGELRYIVSDLQGIDLDLGFDTLDHPVTIAPARQHLIYFPQDPGRADAFIASHTSTWGGGTRALDDLLRVELEQGGKGAVFLAHPVNYDPSQGPMRLGPDIVPYSEAQLGDAFASQHVLGLQAWNEDKRLFTTKASNGFISSADGLTPFVAGTTRWGSVEESPELFTFLHHGIAAWDRMLRWGLDPQRTGKLPWLVGKIRRVFLAGGSDAHGDLNYRRAGYALGVNEVSDTAVGKPRNLVFAGPPAGPRLVPSPKNFATTAPFTQQQVLAGLRAGQFIATDGPIVRVVIDTNRNGIVDATDLPMGSVGGYQPRGDLPLVIEWKSTAEFGPVQRIELVVGARGDHHKREMTFAPREHGVRTAIDPLGLPARTFVTDAGRAYVELDDAYWLDPTGQLVIIPHANEVLGGQRAVVLRPGAFAIGIPDQTTGRYGAPLEPDRLYVRAFARTQLSLRTVSTEVCTYSRYCQLHPEAEDCPGEPIRCETTERRVCDHLAGCAPRFAFTNPVWAERTPVFDPPPDQVE